MSKNKAPLYFLCLYCMQSKRMLSSIHDAYAVFNVAFGKDDGIQEICKDFGVEKSYKIATWKTKETEISNYARGWRLGLATSLEKQPQFTSWIQHWLYPRVGEQHTGVYQSWF